VANEQNLIPQAHVLTVEESSKGGKASGKARREKATMKATLEMLLDEKNKKAGKTYRELATLGLINGAVKGKSENYRLILEIMAEEENKKNGVLDDLIGALNKAKENKNE